MYAIFKRISFIIDVNTTNDLDCYSYICFSPAFHNELTILKYPNLVLLQYLQAQQLVEEQRRQMDMMDMDNTRISEQINLEIQKVKVSCFKCWGIVHSWA